MRTVTLMVLLSAVAVGCSSGEPPPRPNDGAKTTTVAPPPPLPDEDALKEFAKESGSRFSSGDFGGYWDAWSAADKKQTPRDVYVAYAEKCDLGGLPLEIAAARLEPDGKTGIVRYSVSGYEKSVTFVAESGEWRQDTSDETHQKVASGQCA